MSLWAGATPGDYVDALICCGDEASQRAELLRLLRTQESGQPRAQRPTPLEQIVLHQMTRLGLLEHGVSISFGWRTPLGDAVMEYLARGDGP